jgi:hypothetical protein
VFAELLLNNAAKPDNAIKPSVKQNCFTNCLSANTIKIQNSLKRAKNIFNVFVGKHIKNSKANN